MYTKLYLIGNGFDKHHGINSGYSDFEEWLRANHEDIYWALFRTYGRVFDDLWRTFEETIGNVPLENIIEDSLTAPCVTVSGKTLSGATVSPEVGYDFRRLFLDISTLFYDWVLQLKNPKWERSIALDKEEAIFINFNYTSTLEDIYGVKYDNILYIHGNIHRDGNIIIGHSMTKEKLIRKYISNNLTQGQQEDVAYAVNQISEMYKDTSQIMSDNSEFLNRCQGIKHLFVYGLSCSDVDMPYLQHIAKKVPSADWEFSYFSDKDLLAITKVSKSLHINNPKFVKLHDLVRKHPVQLRLFESSAESKPN